MIIIASLSSCAHCPKLSWRPQELRQLLVSLYVPRSLTTSSSVGTMFAALSRHANSVKYTPLGRSRLQLRTFRFFNSRRHAIIAAAVLLVLLLLVTSGISRHQIGGSHDWSFESLPENVIDAVDWSRFAYTQYATNAPYLCNSVMLFESLHRLGSRAERLLMYPSRFEVSANGTDGQSWESGLLRKARDEYNVKLKPVEVVQRESQDGRLECFQP